MSQAELIINRTGRVVVNGDTDSVEVIATCAAGRARCL
jgi:hypothetical protein